MIIQLNLLPDLLILAEFVILSLFFDLLHFSLYCQHLLLPGLLSLYLRIGHAGILPTASSCICTTSSCSGSFLSVFSEGHAFGRNCTQSNAPFVFKVVAVQCRCIVQGCFQFYFEIRFVESVFGDTVQLLLSLCSLLLNCLCPLILFSENKILAACTLAWAGQHRQFLVVFAELFPLWIGENHALMLCVSIKIVYISR